MTDADDLLIRADDLRHRLDRRDRPAPIVLDSRFNLADTDEGTRQYRAGHIPGARYAHLDRDLSGPILPGKTGRHPLPSPASWQATLRRWGVSNDSELVVYDAGNAMFAARAWWLCRWAGLTVRVLDGGWRAWQDIGGVESTGTEADPAPGTVAVDCPSDWVIEADALRHALDRYQLLDARAEARYSGASEPLDSKAGHIPGARCADFTANLDDRDRFKPVSQLRDRFAAVAPDAEVVSYCGSGVTACHTVLALMLAGHPRPTLYAGSWSEWITDDRRPIETGPPKEPL